MLSGIMTSSSSSFRPSLWSASSVLCKRKHSRLPLNKWAKVGGRSSGWWWRYNRHTQRRRWFPGSRSCPRSRGRRRWRWWQAHHSLSRQRCRWWNRCDYPTTRTPNSCCCCSCSCKLHLQIAGGRLHLQIAGGRCRLQEWLVWRGAGELDSSERQVNPVRVTGDSLGRRIPGFAIILLVTVDCSAGGEWWCHRRQTGWLLLAAHSRRAGGEVGCRMAQLNFNDFLILSTTCMISVNCTGVMFDCFLPLGKFGSRLKRTFLKLLKRKPNHRPLITLLVLHF